MHLKQKAHCFGFLVYTISTITLSSVGWCEPTNSLQTPSPALFAGRASALTTKNLTHPHTSGVKWRLQLGSRSRNVRRPSHFKNDRGEDGTANTQKGREGEGEGPERRLEPSMVSPTSGATSKGRFRRLETKRERLFTSHDSHSGNCSSGYIRQVVPGKFYITGQFKANIPHQAHQSDSAVSVQAQESMAKIRGQLLSGSEESWQKLQPVVECGEDAMTLTVNRGRLVQLFLDRANDSSLPLFQLPAHCGYSIQTTWRDLSLMARYDACHVTQENDNHVLPLLWRETPVKMSCPVSQIKPLSVKPSSLCCSPSGMTVKVQLPSATEEPSIKVRGEWIELSLLAEQCGFTWAKRDAEIVIAVPFISCGITVKDGKYTLHLQIGPKILTLACPVSSIEGLPATHLPLTDSPPNLIRRAMKPMLGPFGPLPWIPPFYLAPPYYPHPTYHHNFLSPPKGRKSYNLPTLPSLTPGITFSLQSHPPVSSQPNYQDHNFQKNPIWNPYERSGGSNLAFSDEKQNQEAPVSDVSEKHSAATTNFPAEVEAPHSQAPSHDFSPYYHYYHHPKIPLPGTPQNPHPGPGGSGLLSSAFSHSRSPFFNLNVQQTESSSKDASDEISPPKTAVYPYTPPNTKFPNKVFALYAPCPPYHYFYSFPQFARGEVKRLGLLHPGLTKIANLSFVRCSHSPVLPGHDRHGMNPGRNEPKSAKPVDTLSRAKLMQDDNKTHSASVTPAVPVPVAQSYLHRPDPVAVPPIIQAPRSTLGFIYNPNPYQYYYHPYYNKLMYYRSDALHGANDHPSPTSSKNLNPLLPSSSSTVHQPSHLKHQTTTPPTKSMHDFQTGLLHPYYYYYFYQPQVAKYNQELRKPDSKASDKGSTQSENLHPSNYDFGRKQWFARSSEAQYPSTPLLPLNPFQSLYSYYMTQQHPYWQHSPYFGQYSGNPAKEKLDNKMRDNLKANPYNAPPCGLGPDSDIDCRNPLGCCSYKMKDGAVGQYFVFAVPYSVVEPTVVRPALSSEDSNVSCVLQRLASDLDIYIVPLDGCGVNKRMFGQTMVHLLEVQGMQPHKDGSSAHKNSPVRFMVGCSSSPDTSGEVRFHMMDQRSQPSIQLKPAAISVLFRIATDGSFTNYYSEAHLPLSLLQGKPVYVELSLLAPLAPNLVLVVHSCLAYTLAPYVSWILLYDSCSSQGFSQLLPSPDTHHIRRIKITSFPSLPLESSTHTAHRGYSLLQDPEIYFLCLTETCSAADGSCSIDCIKGPNSDMQAMK